MPRVDNSVFYNASLQKYGLTPQGVHWNTPFNQRVRFKELLKLVREPLERVSLADAGCGFADLYTYMTPKPKDYVGFDLMEAMVIEARVRSGCKILHLNMLEDALPEADYYLCSGSMNTFSRFETQLFIKRALQHAHKGFVFNILKGKDESLVYNYYEPHEIRAIAKEEGVTCKIVTGYLPRDMSVGLYK
jgi:hypothetical protein